MVSSTGGERGGGALGWGCNNCMSVFLVVHFFLVMLGGRWLAGDEDICHCRYIDSLFVLSRPFGFWKEPGWKL